MSVWFKTSLLVVLAGCAGSSGAAKTDKPVLPVFAWPKEPADAVQKPESQVTLIRGATVFTVTGAVHTPGYVLMRHGRIAEVGAGDGPQVDNVIDATGKFVTPGIIDSHSHMGVYANPGMEAFEDGNEMTSPSTPEVWAEHAFWPQDPSLRRAVQGGVTTIQVLPGSANLIGGRSFTAKLKPGVSAREMRFPGAKQGLKMACGENPKRVYGEKGGPQTRMGNVYGYRKEFQAALEYRHSLQKYERDLAAWQAERPDGAKPGDDDPPEPPGRDFGKETLVKVLNGDILVHNHCYRADEMHIMLDLANEFGFSIRSFHHALEAYKLSDRLAKENVSVSTWSDWWGFKMEALDGVPQNAAMVASAGGKAIIHSDSPTEIRYLNQEAAKALTAGRKVGIELTDNEALRWITLNPAWALGVDDQTGSLEPGKMADVVIWDQHPLSVYARTLFVFIDGEKVYDRALAARVSDFELGQSAESLP